MILHPYVRFRIRLARHAVAQLTARLRSSAEIVALVLGNVLLAGLALAAMPAMLAASQPLRFAVPLLLAHGLAMSLPIALLRPRVVPPAVRVWLIALPVPPRLELRAAAMTAGLLGAPLALAYAASLAIWLHQAPAWLAPEHAVAGTVSSLLLTWAAATGWLMGAVRPPHAGGARRHAAPAVTQRPAAQPRQGGRALHGSLYWSLWWSLFWLPSWRNGSLVGPRQAALLGATLAAIGLWLLGPALLPRAGGAILASGLLVALVHDADSALRTHAARVREAAAGCPVDVDALVRRARGMLLLLIVVPLAWLAAAGAAAHAWSPLSGRLYLALACGTPPLLVCTPPFTARGRMALVALLFVVLCATGSTIWN